MTTIDAIDKVCKSSINESAGVLHSHYWLNKSNLYNDYITKFDTLLKDSNVRDK